MYSRYSHESSITPEGVSTFEYIVRHLHLSPEEYATSAELKEWVRENKDQKYVPTELLEIWRFDVNVTIYEPEKKKTKRIA
jgi:hypothetical protein